MHGCKLVVDDLVVLTYGVVKELPIQNDDTFAHGHRHHDLRQ